MSKKVGEWKFFVFVSNLVNCFGDILRNSGSGFDSLFSQFFKNSYFVIGVPFLLLYLDESKLFFIYALLLV